MTIHPKTSGAALGAALGLLIVSVLGSVHGVNLTSAAQAAIPGFLSTAGAWIVPAGDTTSPPPPPPPDQPAIPPAA